MSQNQTRANKTEGQSQRPSRSTSHRGFSGGGGGGGGGGRGGGGAQPPLSSNPSASPSFKKSGNGQSQATGTSVSFTVLNGNHGPLSSPGGSSELQASSAGAKPVDTLGPRNLRAIPKAISSQSSQSVGGSSNIDVPFTPLKGDASQGAFPLQFGSISPGIMNGTQIPARTSSAPPNLDEQKRAQARHDSFRAKPTMPTPSAPKQHQQQTGKDVNGLNQSSIGESHPLVQTKRDVRIPISSASSAIPQKSSVLPIGGMARNRPFQQNQVPMQFGGPNPQMQSQVVASNTLQMTMALPVINGPQVPQQMFGPNIQSHPLPPHTMMHQGQGLGFAPQIGHQLPPQLGNMGFGMAPQFSQPQPVKFVGPRKTIVKITHPDTHEELRLDKRTDSHMDTSASRQRPLPNITPLSQPIQNFSYPHQINYYPTLQPNTYDTSPMFYPTPNSQLSMSSHGPRYSYPVGQSGQTISFMNPSPASGSKPGPPPSLHGVSGGANVEPLQVSATSAPIQPTIRPAVSLSVPRAGIPSVTINKDSNKSEAPNLLKSQVDARGSQQKKDGEIDQKQSVEPRDNTSLSVAGRYSSAEPSLLSAQRIESGTSLSLHRAPVGESRSIGTGFEGCKGEPIRRSDSMNEHQEKTSKTEHDQQQNQTDVRDAAGIKKVSSKIINDTKDIVGQETAEASEKFQSVSVSDCSTISSLPSPTVEHDGSAEHRTSVAVNAKAAPSGSGSSAMTVEKEVSRDSSLGSVSLELATSSYSSDERDSLEASTSLCSKVEQTVSEISNSSSCLHEHKLAEAEQVQDSLTSMEHCINEVPSNLFQNSDSARSYPVPSMTHSSQTVSAMASTGQEVNKVENSKEPGICALSHGYEKIQNRKGVYCGVEVAAGGKELDVPSPSSNFEDAGFPLLSSDSDEQDPSYPDAIVNKSEITGSQDVDPSDLGTSVTKLASGPYSGSSESKQECDGNVTEVSRGEPVSVMLSGSKDKPISEPARAKTNVGKNKTWKGILSKADAAGTSDLYNAYKRPEEKQETVNALESVNLSLTVDAKHMVANDHKDDVSGEEVPPSKAEIDDWEDEAVVSTPHLRTLEDNQHIHEAGSRRRYTRDFLLAFSEQCADLPEGFEMGADIAEALMIISVGTHIFNREAYPSPGRMPDRSPRTSRADRRMVGLGDDNKWTKAAGSFGTGRDIRLDMNYGSANISFRPAQGVNHVAIRNSRAQSSSYFASGILPGPMQSQSSQGVPRSNADADRWQRSPDQRGLIPSPHMPSQVMHKAARKYEIGRVSDLEEAKQRQLKAILNKLTPQNFEKLFLQVKEVNIDNTITLTGVISQIFDKALMEPTFCEMYANFCVCLSNELPHFSEDNEKITFKRLLLNKCQEEFERDEREQAEANRTEEEGEIKQTEAEREEKRIQARRRMLGNIRLIGELYKKGMLTERIMHECIKKLLGESQDPDEEDLEALCKLMSTIGDMIDHAKAKGHMDAYFNRMLKLSTSQKLSSRVRFMLRDAIDLRKNNWQQRRKVEGPKKIDEVHRDAAQERQAQAGRLTRGPVITSAPRRGPTVDYSHRGSSVLSSNSQQIGGTRGLHSQFRGPATQDARMEDRNHFESRVLSVPLPQRTIDNSSITLGPQGGLARGMSIRGQPLISSIPSSDNSLNVGGPRRLASGPDGYSSIPREESVPRYMQDKLSGAPYDARRPQDTSFCSRDSQIADRVIDRFAATTSSGSVDGSSTGILVSSSESKPLSEEILREKSVSTIREFYSAKDEEEVALCIKELNSPSFYPSMISLWVTDSFERKEMERDLLARLLVNLCKCQDRLFSQSQLMQGFESVLSSLEDAVNDAPKAAEFLGYIFAKVTLEGVLPLSEIERLVYEGGEEPRSLVESGLASEVLGSILEFIRTKKGDSVFNNIRVNSKLRLEDFLPPHPTKTNKLHTFL